MLRTRIITALILIVAFLAALFLLPPIGWIAFSSLGAVLAAWEWGALIGLGVDAATAGLSGGMGAAIGGVIGGVLSNMGSLSDRLSGVKTIHIDPATITLLATRAQGLILALMQRGHAAQQALDLQAAAVIWPNSNLPSPLRRARSHAEWSALNGVKESKAAANRHEAAQELQQILSKSLSSNRQH